MRAYMTSDVLIQVVRRELRWYRHYWGEVLSTNDRLGAGRVQVKVPELRWMDASVAPWCCPRLGTSIAVPVVGSKVEVYFVDGSPSRPVYLGRVPELLERLPGYSSPSVEVAYSSQDGAMQETWDGSSFSIGKAGLADSARKGDAVASLPADDATFWTWFAAAAAVLATLGVVAPIPTSLMGKVTQGSSTVKVGS